MYVKELSKAYGTTPVIDRLTLSFPDQGIISLMGPSGCGKTTLLRLLSGLLLPDTGSIDIPAPVSYSFQEPRLLPWFNCLDQLLLTQKKKSPTAVKTAEDLLCRIGLGGSLTKYPSELSGGMAQRVNLARALYVDAPLLLLDEPLKGLDDKTRGKMVELILERRAHNGITLLVTHDQRDTEQLAEKCLLFESCPLHTYSWIG